MAAPFATSTMDSAIITEDFLFQFNRVPVSVPRGPFEPWYYVEMGLEEAKSMQQRGEALFFR
jgi:hypothetical protein